MEQTPSPSWSKENVGNKKVKYKILTSGLILEFLILGQGQNRDSDLEERVPDELAIGAADRQDGVGARQQVAQVVRLE